MTTILPGAEPFKLKGDLASVLLLHGFTGTPQSMRHVGEELNRRYGFAVAAPRLAGHGTTIDDMETTGYLDWLNSAEDALLALAAEGRPLFVAGLSMGGALALNLAARFGTIIKGAVSINAPGSFPGSYMAGVLCDPAAPARKPGIGADIKAQGGYELAYSEMPVGRLREARLLFALTSNLLPMIRCPVTVIHSREDHVIPPRNALDIVNNLTASDHVRLVWLNESYHVATLDNDKDLIVTHAGEFIAFLLKLAAVGELLP